MTSRSAAKRYARALFDVALNERSDVDQIGRDLSSFAALVAGNEGLQRALSNPAVPASRKRAVVEQILARSPLGPLTSRLLLLLAERDRLALLPDVDEAYASRLMDYHQVVRAQVTTATELPADRISALTAGLARVTGRQVQLETRVDPRLVGGAVARVGSTVYDGSVTTQLEKIRQRLIDADV